MNGDGAEAALPSVPNGQISSVAHHSAPGQAVQKSNLILPVWDGMCLLKSLLYILIHCLVPPPKPLHPSHDLISLLSLASLYNSYVRPYASGVDDDSVPGGAVVDGEGVKNEPMGSAGLAGRAKGGVPQRQKGTRLERGYTSLLDDCIGESFSPKGHKACKLMYKRSSTRRQLRSTKSYAAHQGHDISAYRSSTGDMGWTNRNMASR